MKKLIACLLLLCMILSFTACGGEKKESENTHNKSNTSNTTSTITPLLYKVTDDNNNTIWLFGSMHVGKDYFYPLPDYVLDAYNNADALAVEADIVTFSSDISAQTQAIMKLTYQDGTNIKSHLPSETYNKAVSTLKEIGTYNSLFDMYMPFLWYSLIENELTTRSGYDSEYGIDAFFLNDAHDNGKEIREVESADFQYSMMAGFSEELQILLLEEILESYDNPETYYNDMKELATLWEQGDEKEFSQYLSEEGEFDSDEERMLYEEYNNALITERNISMTEYAEKALKSGDEVFICVGAAHVVGADGMAQQLQERGYKVEIIG